MAKDTKTVVDVEVENVAENAMAAVSAAVDESAVIDSAAVNKEVKPLYVERERFKSKTDGKEYWGYYVRGVLRGVEKRAHLIPPDMGGYDVLDLVFGKELTAELVLIPYQITDEKTSRVQRGYTYEIQNFDSNEGIMYHNPIKPARQSDKSLLNMFLVKAGIIAPTV